MGLSPTAGDDGAALAGAGADATGVAPAGPADDGAGVDDPGTGEATAGATGAAAGPMAAGRWMVPRTACEWTAGEPATPNITAGNSHQTRRLGDIGRDEEVLTD